MLLTFIVIRSFSLSLLLKLIIFPFFFHSDEIFDYASVFGSLEDWLEAIKMSQYTNFFQERGFISPKQLMNFTIDDLQDIGIAPIGHRKKILKAIRTTRFQVGANVVQ